MPARSSSSGAAFLPLPKVISCAAAMLICLVLGLFMARSDTGKAIRAVAKERQGARLVGIDVEHIFAVSYGIGIACLGAAACLLMPTFYVTPQSGYAFVLVAFTIVVLGGMGSFVGAAVGGFLIGVTESIGGLFLGEQLGQIGISLIFILILLLKPTGLFGSRRMRNAGSSPRRCSPRRDLSAAGAELPDHGRHADVLHRLHRPVVERRGRLRRPDLVRPCGVLRRRRLHLDHPACQLRLEPVARLAGRDGDGRRWSAPASPSCRSAPACAAPTSR